MPSNLAATSTSFLGRGEYLARLDELRAGGARLISIIGPPGIGKTRLAIHHAQLRAAGATDTWFCDLGDARTVDAACSAIASACGVLGPMRSRGADATRWLGDALAGQPAMVVVLDNCEQAIAAIGRVVSRCLELAANTAFLVTSRELLKLRGEHVVELDQLALPTGRDPAGAADAVKLFVDRARACRARPFSDGELEAVAEIARRLDGIPLAIELAAARMSVMTPNELLARLSTTLELLADGPRDAVARHRTMREAIAWSWSMLSPDEQAVFRCCAVFRGGFTLAAAEEVLLDAGSQRLQTLQSLRDKSLLRWSEPHADGESRLDMFCSLREFAAAELASSSDLDRVRARHAAFYVQRATEWADQVPRHAGITALHHLIAELGNICAIIDAHLATSELTEVAAEQLVAALLAVESVYRTRGPLAAYAAMLDRCVERVACVQIANGTRARLFIARAATRHECGRETEARADAEHALALEIECGDRLLAGRATFILGQVRYYDDPPAAFGYYERALAIQREAGDAAFEQLSLYNIAELLQDRGELSRAADYKHESLSVCRRTGNLRGEARCLASLGFLLLDAGKLSEAGRTLDDALALLQQIDDRQFTGLALASRAMVCHELDELSHAHTHYRAALPLLRAAQNPCHMYAAAGAARLAQEQGDFASARIWYGDALRGAIEVGDRRSHALCMAQLASLEAALGDVGQAEHLLVAATDRARDEPRTVLQTIAVYGGHVAAARCRAHLAADRVACAVDAFGDAQQQLRASAIDRPGLDLRAARRLLAGVIGSPDGRALLLGPHARWFVVPNTAEQVCMTDRDAPRRILLALVHHRMTRPSGAAAIEALIEDGWPGERVIAQAAAGRLYTAIATLRRRGLRELVVTVGQGYQLAPDVTVVLASGDERPI